MTSSCLFWAAVVLPFPVLLTWPWWGPVAFTDTLGPSSQHGSYLSFRVALGHHIAIPGPSTLHLHSSSHVNDPAWARHFPVPSDTLILFSIFCGGRGQHILVSVLMDTTHLHTHLYNSYSFSTLHLPFLSYALTILASPMPTYTFRPQMWRSNMKQSPALVFSLFVSIRFMYRECSEVQSDKLGQ